MTVHVQISLSDFVFGYLYQFSNVFANHLSRMAHKASKKLLSLIHGYCRIESKNMNIIDGIIAIIFEYHQIATWSNMFKGESIELTEDDSKAVCIDRNKEARSVRANFSINRGQIISWELECYQTNVNSYFYGVVSSKQQDFDGCPNYDKEKFEDPYGIDDCEDGIYLGSDRVYSNFEESVDATWYKPRLPEREVFTLKIIADWKDRRCKLTFFYEGKKLNESNDEYTILLPELDDEDVWYPCVTPHNKDAYCIIRYV